MHGLIKNLTGQKFGELTALEYAGRVAGSGIALWKCRCSCGAITIAWGSLLRRGHTRSCGHLKKAWQSHGWWQKNTKRKPLERSGRATRAGNLKK